MINSIFNKINLLYLTEPDTLFKRIGVRIAGDWKKIDQPKKRLLVNHDYHFIYCPIHKNASTSMMALLLELASKRATKKVEKFSSLEARLYVEINHSLANYSWHNAQKIINGDYFKFTIVRNPWARLVSTYTNFLVRLPLESGIVTEMAKEAYRYSHSKDGCEEDFKSVSFNQFARYVSVTDDSNVNIHCVSQSRFLSDIKYDFIAKIENLDSDLSYLEKKLNFPVKIKRFNKTDYSKKLHSRKVHNLSPDQLKSLKGGIPGYESFYDEELIELVKNRYLKDVQDFEYAFS
jgi:hypothetical protein